MTDLEKVIGELEYCRHNPKCDACEKCQYGGRSIMTCESLVDDSLALLKEQEDEITALSIALALYEKQDIVRCKDCRHYKPYTGRVSGNLYHECEHFDRDIDDPEWFCADGERAVEQND